MQIYIYKGFIAQIETKPNYNQCFIRLHYLIFGLLIYYYYFYFFYYVTSE
jgi:hypothetical protein